MWWYRLQTEKGNVRVDELCVFGKCVQDSWKLLASYVIWTRNKNEGVFISLSTQQRCFFFVIIVVLVGSVGRVLIIVVVAAVVIVYNVVCICVYVWVCVCEFIGVNNKNIEARKSPESVQKFSPTNTKYAVKVIIWRILKYRLIDLPAKNKQKKNSVKKPERGGGNP